MGVAQRSPVLRPDRKCVGLFSPDVCGTKALRDQKSEWHYRIVKLFLFSP